MADTTLTRLESFPFDSKLDGYDDYGYPVYDRAVGATVLRATFEKFFTDGVFPSPGSAFVISKADGLKVTVQPGICIIGGAMGGFADEPMTVTLDTAAPQGRVAYGLMLRCDVNDDARSLYLRVAKGEAGGAAPAPESAPGIRELRLGTVTVPSGAKDLSGATVTNEKGTDACPFAAPFERLDLSGVVEDARAEAQRVLVQLAKYVEANKEFIGSALDGSVAGNLQNQINALRDGMTDAEFVAYVTGTGEWAMAEMSVRDGPVWQWDTGRVVEVSGAEPGDLLDAARGGACVALTVAVGDDGTAPVPDQLLRREGALSLFLRRDGHVAAAARVRVLGRARPGDYVESDTPTVGYQSLRQEMLDRLRELEGDVATAGLVKGVEAPLSLSEAGILSVDVGAASRGTQVTVGDEPPTTGVRPGDSFIRTSDMALLVAQEG